MIEFDFENVEYNLNGFIIEMEPPSKKSYFNFTAQNVKTTAEMYEEDEEGNKKFKKEFEHKFNELLLVTQKYLSSCCIKISKDGKEVNKANYERFFEKALDWPEFDDWAHGYCMDQKKS